MKGPKLEYFIIRRQNLLMVEVVGKDYLFLKVGAVRTHEVPVDSEAGTRAQGQRGRFSVAQDGVVEIHMLAAD